jgi:hypothetical protein
MSSAVCSLDRSRLAVLRPCMANDFILENWRGHTRVDPFADPDGFPFGCISKRTVVFSCGVVSRDGQDAAHEHPPQELQLCTHLAAEAAKVVEGLEVGMGSEGTPSIFEGPGKTTLGTEAFSPFFITARGDEKARTTFSEALIREKFGGVIYRNCVVRVEPLREAGKWWDSVLHWYSDSDEEESAPKLAQWRKMMRWFAAQKDFTHTGFVMIGDGPEHGGASFPRLALGLTKAGSLAGLIGVVVHT